MRGATMMALPSSRRANISIHAPHAGRDHHRLTGSCDMGISIHAPHAGRDSLFQILQPLLLISIHAPHAGRDSGAVRGMRGEKIFQSTRPMRGATRFGFFGFLWFPFQSTRPMRGATQQIHRDPGHFRFQSTRPMRGATVRQMSISAKTTIFQSTRPMRGATGICIASRRKGVISIHAPHAGRDDVDHKKYQSFL